ncbi:VPS9 domain protein [Aspergillus eucalypticola CBS 122712]|uniref:VPS9 domain protein n=1 Tax=Aspergillus eucalypticola (strain CBS 122712 / IBT 29274) TaxID=1448314 RepID=A0A317VCQ4_ASPEC|nr:VPS9 domain protein [Aspergillus eucalypticola CBS 122712]PWY72036.1 VPS9 domain protein [Aspergillus eucalypticola CBS 122712]
MSANSADDGAAKPRLHTARSFPRMDTPATSPFVRSRAKTVQSVAIPESVDAEALPLPLSTAEDDRNSSPDLFEKSGSADLGYGDDVQQSEETSVLSRGSLGHTEELPIELASMTDRFVHSLTAKVHSSPPTIEKVSSRFQEFYIRAESHIATHISALASRINRDPSPYRAAQGKSSNTGSDGRQMLTASEVTERRIARKHLATKRVALEEAVERRACETIYDKLWRHKSTLDEIRDEKLRSKTAALSVVGINLKDLGVEIDLSAIDEDKQKEADECLSAARDCLAKMNDDKYPLGKLQQLAAAHKAIVDALTKLLPSSSSADEILPTLIYSLITCPPEGINVISNLQFIQRFRSSNKIDGETAYCLTNLEAAVSFLENVDLSELRGEEAFEGQTKASNDDSTAAGKVDSLPSPTTTKEAALSSVTPVTASPELSKPVGQEASNSLPRPQSLASTQQRRLNNLFQPPAKVLGAANDAVRNTADQGLKNIGASLDSSFNFLFGRLKELQSNQFPVKDGNPVLPKTLADARRLVNNPISTEHSLNQDENAGRESRPVDRPQLRRIGSKAEDTFLGLVSGQRTPRDRSVESVRTQGSSRKATVSQGPQKEEPQASPASATSQAPTPLESVRNFGNTLNPLNHIPGMIRNFGRGVPGTPDTPGSMPSPNTPTERIRASILSRETSSSIVHSVPPRVERVDPPIQRFLQMQNANELTIADVSVLLDDYKRLAAALSKQNP